MPSPTVVSLAILKVNWDIQKRDYLENFVPLVAECIRDISEEVISLTALQSKMKELFGIRIPHGSLDRLLSRAKQRGYVSVKDHVYRKNPENLAKLDFQKVRSQVLRMHDAMVLKLTQFAEKRFKLKWRKDQAEEALQSFLAENHFFLTSSDQGINLIQAKRASPESSRYVVASFIQSVLDTEGEERAYLETLSKGHMLANAIFLPEQSRVTKKFSHTKIFFDTSFLLYALGYAGIARKDARIEMLDLLKDVGAELRCFAHTVDEIQGILHAIAHKIGHGGRNDLYGPSAEYFARSGHTSSDIFLLSAQLPQDLAKIGIRITPKPDYAPEHLMDEKGLSDAMAENYRNPQALQRDVDSVSAVLRLREGREPIFLEDCRSIFVTTNGFLAEKVGELFFKEAPQGVISPCLTDYALMNMLWLKQPLKAPDLPWKRVIADCYAATQPDEYTWRAYLKEIEKLEKRGKISVEDYYLLRYSIEAKTELMDLTLGRREEVFSEGTVQDILARAKDKMQDEIRENLLTALRDKVTAEEANRHANEVILKKIEGEEKVKVQIRERAVGLSRLLFLILRPLVVALLLVGAVITFPAGLPPVESEVGAYVLSAFQVLMAALSIIGMIWGRGVAGILSELEARLAGRIESRLRKFVGLGDSSHLSSK